MVRGSTGRHADWPALGRTAYQRLFAREKGLFDTMGLKTSSRLPELRLALGDELLRVHKNYQPAIAAIRPGTVNAAAHITGGGLIDNLPRVLPKTVRPIFAVVPGGCRRSSKSFSVVGTSARSKCIRFLTWASDGADRAEEARGRGRAQNPWSRCWGDRRGLPNRGVNLTRSRSGTPNRIASGARSVAKAIVPRAGLSRSRAYWAIFAVRAIAAKFLRN